MEKHPGTIFYYITPRPLLLGFCSCKVLLQSTVKFFDEIVLCLSRQQYSHVMIFQSWSNLLQVDSNINTCKDIQHLSTETEYFQYNQYNVTSICSAPNSLQQP